MFRRGREFSERLDHFEAGAREHARALEQVRIEIQATREAIAGAFAEARDAVNASGDALRERLTAAEASLASADVLEKAGASIAQIKGRVEAMENAQAELSRSLGDRADEIAALRSELSELASTSRAAFEEAQSSIRKSSERTAGAFAQADSRMRLLAEGSKIDAMATRLESVENRIGAVHERISRLIHENVEALRKPASEIEAMRSQLSSSVAELKDWRERLASEARQNLNDLRTAIAKSAEQDANLKRAVDSAAAEVRIVSQEVGAKLSEAIDRHLAAKVVPRIESMLEDIRKLLARLEARGASPFKSTQARIVEVMLKKNYIGEKHQGREAIFAGMSAQERGLADEGLDDLVRKSVVHKKPAAYGEQYSLNSNRLDDAQRILNGEDVP